MSDWVSTEDDDKAEITDSVTTPNSVDEIMALENSHLNKSGDDDTDLLLQMIYPEYRPVFSLAQLIMELLLKIGRYLEKPDLIRLLLTDRTVSRHPVVSLRLLQLKREERILWWALGQ